MADARFAKYKRIIALLKTAIADTGDLDGDGGDLQKGAGSSDRGVQLLCGENQGPPPIWQYCACGQPGMRWWRDQSDAGICTSDQEYNLRKWQSACHPPRCSPFNCGLCVP